MKKLFTILALLAFLVVPAASMAMVQTSDADLAAITGQSGVDITVSSATIALNLGTLTWGDYDGYGTVATNNGGFVNVVFYPVPMHIGISGVALAIDVGTSSLTGKTAVNIGVSGLTMTIDAIVADVVLDSKFGAVQDYIFVNGLGGALYSMTTTVAGAGGPGQYIAKTLGVFGISGISVYIPNTLVITIAPH